MTTTKEQRAEIVNTWTLEQSKERMSFGLRNENPITPETAFFMSLSNILATEAGVNRLLSSGELTEDQFLYVNLLNLTQKHRAELIETGRLVS